MALVVEDGSGRSNAESYISEADADTYIAAHGDPTAWSGAASAAKEIALREGAAYLDLYYGQRWKGTRSSTTQALTWPRLSCTGLDNASIESTEIPQRIKDANCEAALKHIVDGGLFVDVSNAEAGAVRTRVKVGEIEEEVEYAGTKTQRVVYSRVHQLVLPFISGAGVIYRG